MRRPTNIAVIGANVIRFVAVCVLSVLCAARVPAQDPTVCEGQDFPDFCFMDPTLNSLQSGRTAWGDLDGDGDLDLVITGNEGSVSTPVPVTQFYRNDGDVAFLSGPPESGKPPPIVYQTTYVEIFSSEALDRDQELWDGTAAWVDYNGDGRLDLLVMGVDVEDNHVAQIYENNGEQLNMTFTLQGFRAAAADWGDVDNDGDLDLAMMGYDEDRSPTLVLVENQVREGFGFVGRAFDAPGVAGGSLDWGDYDRDGDHDLLVAGITTQAEGLTAIYRNDGGTMVDAGADLAGPFFPRAAWGDYDDDGDLDVISTGGSLNPFVISGDARIFRNDAGSFSEVAQLDGRFLGSVRWVDFDRDGDLDAHISGGTRVGGDVWATFYANSAGSFTPSKNFGGGLFGGSEIADYDGDGDLDVLIIGLLSTEIPTLQQYRNEIDVTNEPPQPPSLLTATPVGNDVVLSWQPTTDAETSSPGLTYNVRVGTTPNGQDIMPAHVGPSGVRLISDRGNVDHNTQWTIRGLTAGTYYWSVQALDHGFAASAFAPEGSFTIAP